MSSVDAENANVIPVFVNNCEGLLVIPKEEDSNSTLMWFDPERNLQFTLDAPLGQGGHSAHGRERIFGRNDEIRYFRKKL